MEVIRSWWLYIKEHRVVVATILVWVIVIIALIIIGYRFDWTGFNSNNQSGKTLWDWLNLIGVLAVPVVVGFGAVWFTTRQGKVVDEENTDNQRETALQNYIDKMSELLLEKNLRDSAEGDEVRTIARVRTLTVLRRLDKGRKSTVLQFLYESGLIHKNKCIVDLTDANLEGASLYQVNLRGANLPEVYLLSADLQEANLEAVNLDKSVLQNAMLYKANLSRANLRECYMWGARLIEANLTGADLTDTYLRNANMSGAIVTEEQLKQAISLKGAKMPDGSIHE